MIPSLVEALRAKYFPMHYDFRMRYVQYELPMETVRKLERLCFVSNMEDLQRKYLEARSWFLETRAGEKENEKLIGTT